MTPADVLRVRRIKDPRISPDGTTTAYVLESEDGPSGHGSSIWIRPTDSDDPPRRLTSGDATEAAPRWSPDGRWIALLREADGGAQVHVADAANGALRRLTDGHVAIRSLEWAPDGAAIFFTAQTPDAAEPGPSPAVASGDATFRVVNRIRFMTDASGIGGRSHVFLAPLAGPVRQLTSGDWDDHEIAVSPDGRSVAFVSNREPDRDTTRRTDVWLLDLSDGSTRNVSGHAGIAATPRWSPDGTRLAYVGHRSGDRFPGREDVYVIDLASGSVHCATAGSDGEIGNLAVSDAHESFMHHSPAWSGDGSAILALVSRHGRVGLREFTLDGHTSRTRLDGDFEVAGFDCCPRTGEVAYVRTDPTSPPEVWLLGDSDEARQLTSENREVAALALVPPRPLWATSADGEEIQGWLLQPAAAPPGGAPLVLYVHGGPWVMYGWAWIAEHQVLAARGYAVVYGNPRGSRGYGDAFSAAFNGDIGGRDADDCAALIDAAIALGGVDPGRVGVAGYSYGGYMAAWLATREARLRAVVAQGGLYDLESFYGTCETGAFFCETAVGGLPGERPERYRERSPLTHVGSIAAPLLLLHAEDDRKCAIGQAEQLFAQLKRRGGVEVLLVRFPSEDHGFKRVGRPDRRLAAVEWVAHWFDTHL